MDLGIVKCAKENHIPVIVMGGTPFELQRYKRNLVRTNPNSKGTGSFMLGYLWHLVRNPKWVLNLSCFAIQVREYYRHYYRKMHKRSDLLVVSPFSRYIRWEEREVTSKIKSELNWRQNPDTRSSWRGDCDIAVLKAYLYRETLGFNDIDDILSELVRDGQISREEALERATKQEQIPEDAVVKVFDKLGLDYADLGAALRKWRNSKSTSFGEQGI